jgi:hypothetical protein
MSICIVCGNGKGTLAAPIQCTFIARGKQCNFSGIHSRVYRYNSDGTLEAGDFKYCTHHRNSRLRGRCRRKS